MIAERNKDKFKRLNSENFDNLNNKKCPVDLDYSISKYEDLQNKIKKYKLRKFNRDDDDDKNNDKINNNLLNNNIKNKNNIKNLLWDKISRKASNSFNKNKSQSYKSINTVKTDYNSTIKNEIKKIENSIKNLKILDIDQKKPKEIFSKHCYNKSSLPHCESKKHYVTPSSLTEGSKNSLTATSRSTMFKSSSNSFKINNKKIVQKYNSKERIFYRNSIINKKSLNKLIESNNNMTNLYNKLMQEENQSKFLEMIDGDKLRQFPLKNIENIIRRYCSKFLGHSEEQINNFINVKNSDVEINRLINNIVEKSRFNSEFTNKFTKTKIKNLLKNFDEKAKNLEKLFLEKRAGIDIYEKDE